MTPNPSAAARGTLAALALCTIAWLLPPTPAAAQGAGAFVITPVVEKKIAQLPAGPLYWRIENFPTLAQAQTAAGPTALAAEVAGKVWLFTLGPKGGATTPGGTAVIEVGPVPRVSASEYLLRINNANGPPGSKTPTHYHPGAEAFYVLSGRLSQKTPYGVKLVEAGQFMPGNDPGTTMEVSSTGTTALNALVMFVVDAGKPFSTPSKFE
jgi:hypothetical protein